jgi:hypothetical protein
MPAAPRPSTAAPSPGTKAQHAADEQARVNALLREAFAGLLGATRQPGNPAARPTTPGCYKKSPRRRLGRRQGHPSAAANTPPHLLLDLRFLAARKLYNSRRKYDLALDGTWWRACSGTRSAHHRCTRAMSSFGSAIGSPAVKNFGPRC